ncbi:hypothetical protein L249_8868 [Ophiocordyceps polyrhachis-furcata BCC 54312]|uniref:Uncharacterized protein n=1 Tax=Ophiocordyceps polyrhachis-furcata BCC 54312 TaxID=1330021 RepID=A0A367L245_9HYPO|nr:hypothetical protein L249_8868 [Ophiocordyceps polyrhachis-furcata BCC 54312]
MSTLRSGPDTGLGALDYQVKLGVWTDWSHGSLMGLTLTLNRNEGSILIAVNALFISVVAASFWRIARLLLHRHLSTPEPRDALHHQRQALLRNSTAAFSTVWSFLQLGWAWRRRDGRAWIRTLPVTACIVLSIVAFTAASILSSRLSSADGVAVLVDGSKCGRFDHYRPGTEWDLQYGNLPPCRNTISRYAQQCYADNVSSGILCCRNFVKNRLESNINYEAPCPFEGSICRSNTSNLMLESGLIDSLDDLGINAPARDRFKIRHRMHCAPLTTEPYSAYSIDNYTTYAYETWRNDSQHAVTTLAVPNLGSQAMSYRFVPNLSDNILIPELEKADGGLFLMFLSGNGVSFLNRSSDLWYRTLLPDDAVSVDGGASYHPDVAASPMACKVQVQLCNAQSQCGPLASWSDALGSASRQFRLSPVARDMFLDDASHRPNGSYNRQDTRWAWFQRSMYISSAGLEHMVNFQQGTALASYDRFDGRFMHPIPDHQWKIDMVRLWSYMLASMQMSPLSYASGQDVMGLRFLRDAPEAFKKELCENQVCLSKVVSTAYSSFNLVGLLLIYILGLIIITSSYMIEPMYEYCWRRKHYKEYKFLEWSAEETLQLQRAAYQGIGSGTWEGLTHFVPTTDKDMPLADLTALYDDGRDVNPQSSRREEKD